VRVVKSIKLCLAVMCGAVFVGGVIVAGLSATAGQARADVPPTLPPPLTAPTSGLKLTQVSAGTWRTTIYLNTAALCLGANQFSLVTAVPYSSTLDDHPGYPDGLRCPATGADPLTEVVLTFTPSPAQFTSVPQMATLTVTPPVSAMALGAAPLEVPLTVRRTINVNQYVWIPVGCGVCLAALLVSLVVLIGVPDPAKPGQRLRGSQREFWQLTLRASATWTFGDSWATNSAGLTALVAAVLSASGTIGGLIPGVDLGRFGLVMALAVGVVGIAPLFFGVLNSLFVNQAGESGSPTSQPKADAAAASDPAKQEVVVSKMWAMLLASFFTVAGIGAELAIVGWVLGNNLMVAPALARGASLIVALILAALFVGYAILSVIALAKPEGGSPLNPRKSAAFILLRPLGWVS
jgi:hypothetical protein